MIRRLAASAALIVALSLPVIPAFAETLLAPSPPVAPTSRAECRDFAKAVNEYKRKVSAAYSACMARAKDKYTPFTIDAHSHFPSCTRGIAVVEDCQAEGEAEWCGPKFNALETQCDSNVTAFLNGKEPAQDDAGFRPPAVGTSVQPQFDDWRDKIKQTPPTDEPPAPENPVEPQYENLHRAFEDGLGMLRQDPDMSVIVAFNDAVATQDPSLLAKLRFKRSREITPPGSRPTIDNLQALLERMAAKAKPLPKSAGIPTDASEIRVSSGGGGSGGGGGGGGGGYSSACGNPYGGPSAPSGAYICSNRGELLACRCGGGRCGLISTGSFLCSRAGAVVR